MRLMGWTAACSTATPPTCKSSAPSKLSAAEARSTKANCRTPIMEGCLIVLFFVSSVRVVEFRQTLPTHPHASFVHRD
jgi:hypothetical protein